VLELDNTSALRLLEDLMDRLGVTRAFTESWNGYLVGQKLIDLNTARCWAKYGRQ
jgi:hypothetical protein